MSYAPTTDFLALLRQTSGGVRTERMPGLDYVAAAMARAGMFQIWVAQTAPVTNLTTTLWVVPSSPNSWAAEALLFLYDTVTAAWVPATPALWVSLFISASVTRVQGLLGQHQIAASRTVNFNLAGDTVIPVPALPLGCTRFLVTSCRITGADGTLTAATAGLFTQPLGAGVQVVTAASAITVASAADATNNNAQAMTVNNTNSETYLIANVPNLYFRIANPQGAARSGTVTITIAPVP